MNRFKFSVVMPIYNVEQYLEEAIESIINQTIGFKNSIQLILVNDGSSDNSEEICLKYKESYPNNIIYITQKNKGVGAARNVGLLKVEGKYVSFLDSDDIWEDNVFLKAYEMFKSDYELSVIGVRIKSFEATTAYHPLDYKFTEDKIIDIFTSPNYIQLSVASAFFKYDSIKDIKFDESIKYAEDCKFVFDVLLKSSKLGLISSSLYLYRKRIEKTSAIQTKNIDLEWYFLTFEKVYLAMIEKSIENFGKVLSYLQYFFAYDFQFRIKELDKEILSETQLEEYLKLLKKVLEYIDDKIILELTNCFIQHKITMLSIKYGYNIQKKLEFIDDELYFQDKRIYKLLKNNFVVIYNLNKREDKIIIEGAFNIYIPQEDYELVLEVHNKDYKIEIINENYNKASFVTDYLKENKKSFCVSFPITNAKIKFKFIYKKKDIVYLPLNFTKMSGIFKAIETYKILDDKLIYRNDRYELQVINKKGNLLKKELGFIRMCLRNNKLKVVFYRLIFFLYKIFNKNDIWIITDRYNKAGDNAEALYTYINKKGLDKKIKVYFAIDKKTNDYKRLKVLEEYGHVIDIASKKYKFLFLNAKNIISSQADILIQNPFGKSIHYYSGLPNNFIFLQHGIILHDLSTWLNNLNKNMRLFITSTEQEYKSILKGNYGYNEDVVKLTGLPRFDNLINDQRKEIYILPTWRLNLAGKVNATTLERSYNSNFKNSSYYNFYSNLITDKRILNKLKENGYKLYFLLHPSFQNQYQDFADIKNENVIVLNRNINYQDIFKRASLLITDYSSVAFDMAYLKKPIIYTQFDRDNFFNYHISAEGYFNYERDGFGPVLYTYEETVKQIISYIDSNCQIEKKYLRRIEKTYKYFDQSNAKRVLKEILKIK